MAEEPAWIAAAAAGPSGPVVGRGDTGMVAVAVALARFAAVVVAPALVVVDLLASEGAADPLGLAVAAPAVADKRSPDFYVYSSPGHHRQE